MMHPSSASWVPPTAARNSRTILDILLTFEILQVELKELSYIWICTKHKSNSLCQKNHIALTCCNWKTFVQGLIVSQCKWNTFQSWCQTPICAYLPRRISIRFVIRIATFPLAAYLAGPICGTVAVELSKHSFAVIRYGIIILYHSLGSAPWGSSCTNTPRVLQIASGYANYLINVVNFLRTHWQTARQIEYYIDNYCKETI